jgi:hypothetical protein
MGVIRRHSLLKRHPRHTRAYFSSYYEERHGPLAARQPGFRKFTTRYLQNHILDLPDGSEPSFDGVSMTTQVPREDYSRGFFGEPDYENVKEDEIYLFDIASTVSLLGEEVVLIDGGGASSKALFLGTRAEFRPHEFPGIARLAENRLDLRSVSALGFRSASFGCDLLAEIWFDTADLRDEAFRLDMLARSPGSPARILPVREVLVFGPENPWIDPRVTP